MLAHALSFRADKARRRLDTSTDLQPDQRMEIAIVLFHPRQCRSPGLYRLEENNECVPRTPSMRYTNP